jgi:2-polyprenyl-6-methoxyphenol hydroxylase-like FAD-dependent oxidoreductase
MTKKIIIVGAGPIGLWTAIQIKLRQPDSEIIIKEQREAYSRNYTLWLSSESFANCAKDDDQIIDQLIQKLRNNPYIRTKKLESLLKELALKLGIIIENSTKVSDIDRDILQQHPDATCIIGADSIHSTVNATIFGADNVEQMPLGYAAQIKYDTKGQSYKESKLFSLYPLLKQSNYLAYSTHGATDDNNLTPVTIQFVIDKDTYDSLKASNPARSPIYLFTENKQEQIPSKLLADIKTQLGHRFHQKENIVLNTLQLTITELPQQRCHTTTLLKDGRYYGLIGDAALGLSYFKGMNSGLQLATKFASELVAQWPQIAKQDPAAFQAYNQHYHQFATTALRNGYHTNSLLKFFRSMLNVSALFPVQSVYIEPNAIVNYQRHFDILQQASQFYMELQENHKDLITTTELTDWLENQMPGGLIILQQTLLRTAAAYQNNALLYKALTTLATYNLEQLDFYDKAFLGLAISKTRLLLAHPSQENHDQYLQFLSQLQPASASWHHIITVSLLIISGIVGLAVGVGAGLGWIGLSLPLNLASAVGGAVLLSLGIYHAWTKPQPAPSPICSAVEDIAHNIRIC